MIDGTYRIELDTPLGHKSGMLTMRTEGEAVFAEIDAPLIGEQSVEGRMEGNGFAAEGTFKLRFVGKVTYNLHGMVEGDDLTITIDSSKGAFELKGKRV